MLPCWYINIFRGIMAIDINQYKSVDGKKFYTDISFSYEVDSTKKEVSLEKVRTYGWFKGRVYKIFGKASLIQLENEGKKIFVKRDSLAKKILFNIRDDLNQYKDFNEYETNEETKINLGLSNLDNKEVLKNLVKSFKKSFGNDFKKIEGSVIHNNLLDKQNSISDIYNSVVSKLHWANGGYDILNNIAPDESGNRLLYNYYKYSVNITDEDRKSKFDEFCAVELECQKKVYNGIQYKDRKKDHYTYQNAMYERDNSHEIISYEERLKEEIRKNPEMQERREKLGLEREEFEL